MQPTDDVSITMQIQEWDRVMQVLVEQPYKHVAVLIQKISDQAKQAETRLARAAPQTALSVVDNDLSA